MAQPQKSKETNREQNKPNLEARQTPPSRQAGFNQPQSAITRSGSRSGGLPSRREQFSPRNPFSFMRRFTEEMDRLFEDFGFGSLTSPDFRSELLQSDFDWSPQTEIFERDNKLVVQADLPGMSKDDISVDIEDDQIIIRGERRSQLENEQEGSFYTERNYGSFYRSIPLPEGFDAERAEANFRNGVLEITMPVPEQRTRRGRRVEIGEGAEKSESGSNETRGGK